MPHRLPVFRLLALTALTAVTAFTASAQAVDTPSAAPRQVPLPIAATGSTSAQKPAPLSYRSVFDSYQPFTDGKLVPWKDTNRTVEHIGGWRAYAKEAPDAPSQEAQDTGPNRADPHAGYGKH